MTLTGDPVLSSFPACRRTEIERFERFVTDREFREYAYYL
jgi:glutamine synthetase